MDVEKTLEWSRPDGLEKGAGKIGAGDGDRTRDQRLGKP
jgi:hypothetical protein